MPRKATPTDGGSDVDTTDATDVQGARSVSAGDISTSSTASTASTARLRRGASPKDNESAATLTTLAEQSSSRVNTVNQSSARQQAKAVSTPDADEGETREADEAETRERGTPDKVLWIEWAWYGVIHCATLGLFLVKKFRWEGWEGWMRFMW
jgi:hypothetical protein